MKKIFLFLLFAVLGTSTTSFAQNTEVISKKESQLILIDSRMFLPCQSDFAVIDTNLVLHPEGRDFIFIGFVSKTYRSYYDSTGRLFIKPLVDELSTKDIGQQLKWKNVAYVDASDVRDEFMGGKLVAIFVDRRELRAAGLLK